MVCSSKSSYESLQVGVTSKIRKIKLTTTKKSVGVVEGAITRRWEDNFIWRGKQKQGAFIMKLWGG